MASIQSIVKDLTEIPGVKGCGVITTDGIMVASGFGDQLDDDLVAGLTSFLSSTIQRVLREGGMPPLTRFVMHSTHGKALLIDLGESYLVVLTDQFGNLSAMLPEIQESVHQLRRQARIRV